MYLKNQQFSSVIRFCEENDSRIRHEKWRKEKNNRRIYFCRNTHKIVMEIYDFNNNVWSLIKKIPFPNYDEIFSNNWEVFRDDLNLKNPPIIEDCDYINKLITDNQKDLLLNKTCYNGTCVACEGSRKNSKGKDCIPCLHNEKDRFMNTNEITPEPLGKDMVKQKDRDTNIFQEKECLLCSNIIGRKEFVVMGTTAICGQCYYDCGGG